MQMRWVNVWADLNVDYTDRLHTSLQLTRHHVHSNFLECKDRWDERFVLYTSGVDGKRLSRMGSAQERRIERATLMPGSDPHPMAVPDMVPVQFIVLMTFRRTIAEHDIRVWRWQEYHASRDKQVNHDHRFDYQYRIFTWVNVLPSPFTWVNVGSLMKYSASNWVFIRLIYFECGSVQSPQSLAFTCIGKHLAKVSASSWRTDN